ncbi:MAG: hypothetical protein V1487_03040 [bacterium]
MIEQLHNLDISILLPFVLITLHQVKAIIDRDGHTCQFPDQHECGRKLSVHHIYDKEDIPENLVTVCSKGAHWGKLHNGATEEDKRRWACELSSLAIQRTIEAYRRGWKFG